MLTAYNTKSYKNSCIIKAKWGGLWTNPLSYLAVSAWWIRMSFLCHHMWFRRSLILKKEPLNHYIYVTFCSSSCCKVSLASVVQYKVSLYWLHVLFRPSEDDCRQILPNPSSIRMSLRSNYMWFCRCIILKK